MTNAPHVQRSSSWCKRENERRVFGQPSRRRSTTRIVPNTVAAVITWMASTIGMAFSELRSHSLRAES